MCSKMLRAGVASLASGGPGGDGHRAIGGDPADQGKRRD
jgi:hypothetical protein